jgi:GAF domain-containing protein
LNKESNYISLYNQAKALVDGNVDDIANMANLTSLLYEHLRHHWIGFYRVVGNRLVLVPFNGPIACTSIAFNKGVCGTSWAQKEAIVVDNVHEFPGHIACSPHSNSEIVIPCIRDNEVFAVLDIDSTEFACFDELDEKYLTKMIELL